MGIGLHFTITPTTTGPLVGLTFHEPPNALPYKGRCNLLGLAAVFLRYKIQADRNVSIEKIILTEQHFPGAEEMFRSAVYQLQNALRAGPVIKMGYLLQKLKRFVKARRCSSGMIIEIDAADLKPRDVYFNILDQRGFPHHPDSEEAFLEFFNYLIGKSTAHRALNAIKPELAMMNPFLFSGLSTHTMIVHRFPEGVLPVDIQCATDNEVYKIPGEIESLVEEAYRVLLLNPGTIRAVPDHVMLAPKAIDVTTTDLDFGAVKVAIALHESSYRYYAAYACAERLANYNSEFDPLYQFTRKVPNPFQPAPASCSMGVRVVVETADKRLVVAHRSNQVKLNPNVWSVSANEGLRSGLYAGDGNNSSLLSRAVSKALWNELRLQEAECDRLTLLSIYRNEFNQWGCGFWVQSILTADEIVARQTAAAHGFEYRQVASLPAEINACGRAMGQLGERWYGGALETLCQVLAWRELAGGCVIAPEEIANKLQAASGGIIRPVDEPNPSMLPTRQLSGRSIAGQNRNPKSG